MRRGPVLGAVLAVSALVGMPTAMMFHGEGESGAHSTAVAAPLPETAEQKSVRFWANRSLEKYSGARKGALEDCIEANTSADCSMPAYDSYCSVPPPMDQERTFIHGYHATEASTIRIGSESFPLTTQQGVIEACNAFRHQLSLLPTDLQVVPY